MTLLETLRGGLVVSCQPVDDGPMDDPAIVAALAQAALAGGAAGVRIEGAANVAAVRAKVSAPIIGLIKRDLSDSPVRITPFLDDVRALAQAGADVIAYDGTARVRPTACADLVNEIVGAGAIAMADCATLADAKSALADGALIVGTTLSGYTAETATAHDRPDLEFIVACAGLGGFVMAEGRFNTPTLAAIAHSVGADCVTVGSAITRTEHVTQWFNDAVQQADPNNLNGYAVDVGGTKTAAARIAGGVVVNSREIPTNAAGDLDTQIDQIAVLLSELGHVKGDPVGVAVTGRLDLEGRWHTVNAGTLPSINGVPLQQDLRARLGHVGCYNDAAATAFAEATFGAGRGVERFVYITVSTGVGGGIVLNGRLVRGDAGLAGHIGFTSSGVQQTTCESGRNNTVESIAAGRAIAKSAVEAGFANTDARMVFAAANAGEAWAETIVDRSAKAIAVLCADLAAMIEPERIAIGGSIGLADGYLARVNAHLQSEPALYRTSIVPATLAADGPLLGALALSKKTQ